MYQHDVSEKLLGAGLDEVVEDCVATVGVNLNTAGATLLQRVSGFTSKVAAATVAYRNKHGRFGRRDQLLKVAGMGKTRFLQAAGFTRVPSPTATDERVLDATAIHPESYAAAKTLLVGLGLKNFGQLGSAAATEAISRCCESKTLRWEANVLYTSHVFYMSHVIRVMSSSI